VLGREVGYAIRFEDCFTDKVTRLKFVTDGLLIREMMQNPLLPQYSVIILDEVHERNVNTDIIIGLLKKIMKKRKDLKIIVCSATVDAEEIKLYFDEGLKKKTTETITTVDTTDTSLESIIVSVEGRYFPVEINYLTEPCDNYMKASVSTAIAIHLSEENHEGDILIFLTGQDECEEVVSQLIDRAKDLHADKKRKEHVKKLWILPLYGTLPASEQLKVFERTPRNTRKIIVSTNLAETSLTINGIVYVIDCGFMKIKAYDSKLGAESLITVSVSKSNACQRAGRAGRYRSGKCFRLYSESEYLKLKDFTPPEMQRCDLGPVILQLKALGVDNICKFDFLSSPPSNNLIDSLELLYALGALDHNSKLTTPLGYQMAEFPLQPTYSKALLNAETFGCTQEILSIIALMQVQNVFVTPSGRKQQADKAKIKFACVEGDHLTLLNVYKVFREKFTKCKTGTMIRWCQENFLNFKALQRAIQIREQLVALLRKFKRKIDSTCGDKTEPILKCLASAFFLNTAKLSYSGEYRHLRSDVALKVYPGSVINLYLANTDEPPPKYVIYNDIVQAKTHHLMRDLIVIDCKWLNELVPNYYEYGTAREMNEKRLRIE
jgi:ATP-dependent RNA helicase DDX35